MTPTPGSRVSVCMATYNGERFLREQIDSILSQLADDDELIICDDASRDGTLDVIRSYRDARIKLFAAEQNAGHVRNFERALQHATGEFIFLTDQDDIWCPDKRATMVAALVADPTAAMAVHALSTIDADGNPLCSRIEVWRHPRAGRVSPVTFLAKQLVRTQIAGCAVALRRSLLAMLLPFPPGTLAHDHWLTAAAPLNGGIVLVDRVLVLYRLHGNNVTPRHGLGWRKRIAYRSALLRHIGTAIARRVGGSPA